MAAEVRLVGGISRTIPDRAERHAGIEPQIYMAVTVGKTDRIREIPLSERQVIALMKDGATMLELLRKKRGDHASA